MTPKVVAQGILFSRSVRSTFCSLSLAPLPESKSQTPLYVRLQFLGHRIQELRSFCRRTYKLGDYMEIRNGKWERSGKDEVSRLVVDISSEEMAKENIDIVQSQMWSMTEWQHWQNKYVNGDKAPKPLPTQKRHKAEKDNQLDGAGKTINPHGSVCKRIQGDHVAKFLVAAVMKEKLGSKDDPALPWLEDISNWSTWDAKEVSKTQSFQQATHYLNSGSGVLDVAGGSGHVSMALGMLGVKSTVVDAREGVGKLPGRDRKIWKKALKRSALMNRDQNVTSDENCLPVVPFDAHRAWFGVRPHGVDATFRHPDQEELSVCDESSRLVQKSSAIVALHPDEATGDIARLAARCKVPLVVVPCCVFARLFPDRKVSVYSAKVVSSYDDLLLYLKNHDSTIRETELPFDGKNKVLWSMFVEPS